MSDAIQAAEQQLEDGIHALLQAGCEEAAIRERFEDFLELVRTDATLRADLGLA